jgi:mannosyltransferase
MALTGVAAALRFYAIGHQSLWYDEAYTVMLVKLPLMGMLNTIPRTESTPYLYYLMAWCWSHIVGRGAGELRALSALIGTAVVPVAYLTAAALLKSRRAALCVAALATFNPLLIWYSQEARAYELLVLTTALSLLAFTRARERPAPGRLALWALVCAVALVSHYESTLVIVPEAIWLLGEHRRRAGAWLAVAAVGACGAALLPLLTEQSNSGNAAWITLAPLNDRLGQILPQFLVGTGSHAYFELTWIGLGVCLAALLLLARGASPSERRGALGAGAVAVGGFAVVMVLVPVGLDTVLTRNLLALWLPAAILVAGGLGSARARRLGLALTAGLCAIGLTATVSVATVGTLEKPDWSAVAHALGPWPAPGQPADASRLLVFQHNVWLESLTAVYLDRTSQLFTFKPRHVAEIDIVANSSPASAARHWLCWWGAACNLYPTRLGSRSRYRIPGFRAAGEIRVRQFTILRLLARRPRRVLQGSIKAVMRRVLRTQPLLYGLLIQRP